MKKLVQLFTVQYLILSFMSTNSYSAPQTDFENYQSAIDQVNDYLVEANNSKGCPGLKLVISCGNLKCEPKKGEDIQSCPADCLENVKVRSYNNITLCNKYTQTHVPKTTGEVADIIKMATAKNLKVKPIGASHSATDIMCQSGVLIPMQNFNKVIGLSYVNNKKVVEVEAGATVFEVSEWLDKKGLALKGLVNMGFRDVTIGGSMATSSHGSSANHTSVISNIVEAVEFVDGLGNIRYRQRDGSDEFKALSAHLGLLGVITKVKLEVQKQFNLAVNVTYHHESKILKEGIIQQVQGCDFGQLNWFPGTRKFVKVCGKKRYGKFHRGANNVLLQPKFPRFVVKPFKKLLQLGTCYNGIMGLLERVRYWQFKLAPPFVKQKRRKLRNSRFVIGPSHRMISSHLTKKQQGLFQMDWELAVPATHAQKAFIAIRQFAKRNKIRLPLVGSFIRYTKSEDKSLMAYTHPDNESWKAGGPVVFFEMPVFIPVGFSKERFKKYEKKYVNFAKMLMEKFDARPHWGKNRDWVFKYAKELGRYPNLERFKAVKEKLDPKGIFSNKFSRSLSL